MGLLPTLPPPLPRLMLALTRYPHTSLAKSKLSILVGAKATVTASLYSWGSAFLVVTH